jgi:hypothetical protein
MTLLDFDLGACSFELLLDLFSFSLGYAGLDGRTAFVNERLGFSKAKSGHNSADFLDDGDFLSATIHKDDVKLSFLFSSGSSTTSGTATSNGHSGHRSSGGHAPLLFEGFYKFSDLKYGQSAEFIYDFANISHVICWYRRSPEPRWV